MYRLKGECWSRTATTSGRGRECFRRAIEIAKKQQAKLGVARRHGLAQLWLAQRRPKEARDLLAPIHAWFREGRETPDLKRAKALLDKTLLDAPAE